MVTQLGTMVIFRQIIKILEFYIYCSGIFAESYWYLFFLLLFGMELTAPGNMILGWQFSVI